jgi:hypothetical protein
VSQGSAPAIVLYSGPRSALVKVPFEYREIVKDLDWRRWDPGAKAWRILPGDLSHLLAALERAGVTVRWRGGRR